MANRALTPVPVGLRSTSPSAKIQTLRVSLPSCRGLSVKITPYSSDRLRSCATGIPWRVYRRLNRFVAQVIPYQAGLELSNSSSTLGAALTSGAGTAVAMCGKTASPRSFPTIARRMRCWPRSATRWPMPREPRQRAAAAFMGSRPLHRCRPVSATGGMRGRTGRLRSAFRAF